MLIRPKFYRKILRLLNCKEANRRFDDRKLEMNADVYPQCVSKIKLKCPNKGSLTVLDLKFIQRRWLLHFHNKWTRRIGYSAAALSFFKYLNFEFWITYAEASIRETHGGRKALGLLLLWEISNCSFHSCDLHLG